MAMGGSSRSDSVIGWKCHPDVCYQTIILRMSLSEPPPNCEPEAPNTFTLIDF